MGTSTYIQPLFLFGRPREIDIVHTVQLGEPAGLVFPNVLLTPLNKDTGRSHVNNMREIVMLLNVTLVTVPYREAPINQETGDSTSPRSNLSW